MKRQKTLTITGNISKDLDRLTEAYANRGWCYKKHIIKALDLQKNKWENLLNIILESKANGSIFWESEGTYVRDLTRKNKINDFCRILKD